MFGRFGPMLAWTFLLTIVFSKPTVQNHEKYKIYKLDDQGPPENSTLSDKINHVYKRIVQDMYPRGQLLVSDGGGIPRKFAETKRCGNMKDPKSMGSKISAAWDEAKQLVMAQTTFRLDYDFDKVHTQWLGKDWNGWGWFYDYKKIVGDDLSNARKLYSTDGFQSHEYIYWYCYDYSNQCDLGTVAYSWSSMYIGWRNHYTVFCPIFEGLQTLEDAIRDAEGSSHKQRIMENFEINKGQVMLHETYHYTVVTNPRTDDYAYKAKPTWDLAKDKSTWYAAFNADSFALDAVAIYVQQHFKQSEPPIPRDYYKLTAAAKGATLPPSPDDTKATKQKVFKGVPPGWKNAPIVDLNPDPTFWTEVVSDGVKPLGAGLNVSVEVFGAKGPPAGTPVSAMKVTTVAPPPGPGPPPTGPGPWPRPTETGKTSVPASSKSATPKVPTPTAPSSPPSAYKQGTCSMHIRESATGESVGMVATIKDGGGNTLTTKTNKKFTWGTTITVSKSDSKLDNDVLITFPKTQPKKRGKRMVGPGVLEPPNLSYEKRLIQIKIGDLSWDSSQTDQSKTPHFNDGGWDNSASPPTRDLDTYWTC